MTAPIVIASFNTHAGIDGWGRPYDLLAACAATGADVLVLQEAWTPALGASTQTGAPPAATEPLVVDGPDSDRLSLGPAALAEALGYQVAGEYQMATGRRALPHAEADQRWKQLIDWRSHAHALYLDGALPLSSSAVRSERYRQAPPGSLGLAVLSRLPVISTSRLELGRLRRDRARRAALVVRLDHQGEELTVVGTHMSHLTYGSPVHYRRLSRRLAAALGPGPAVLVGDMNLWGPPLRWLLPGWHRAVRGRTWPAWRPHSQLDHILVRGPLLIEGGEVLADAGSDHRAVRATLWPTGTVGAGDERGFPG